MNLKHGSEDKIECAGFTFCVNYYLDILQNEGIYYMDMFIVNICIEYNQNEKTFLVSPLM